MWDWRGDNPAGLPNSGSEMGFIAQKVAEVFPNAVVQDPDGILRLKYYSLLAPVVEALREVSDRLERLEEKKNYECPTCSDQKSKVS